MELWIRSQDKEALRKINCSLYLKRDLSDYAEGEVYFIVSSGDKLGEYKTKERALEVLDTIEYILSYNQRKTTKYSYTNSGRLEESSLFEYIVYRMPEE